MVAGMAAITALTKLLGNEKAMKQAEKTMGQAKGMLDSLTGGGIGTLIDSATSFLQSPILVAIEILIAKINEQLVPVIMPLMDKVTSGELDPIFDKIASVIAKITDITYVDAIELISRFSDFIINNKDALDRIIQNITDFMDEHGDKVIDLLEKGLELATITTEIATTNVPIPGTGLDVHPGSAMFGVAGVLFDLFFL